MKKTVGLIILVSVLMIPAIGLMLKHGLYIGAYKAAISYLAVAVIVGLIYLGLKLILDEEDDL